MSGNLYGLKNSNRSGKDLWGKNQFNSAFPASLACYMRDNGIPAVYIYVDENLKIRNREIPINEVFNTTKESSEIEFLFEHTYEPYNSYCYDNLSGIDLVIKENGKYVRPLEVKLTVIPDSRTKNLPENEWGSEIVIRPASTSYCALGIAHKCKEFNIDIRNIFEPVCAQIEDWGNSTEILKRIDELVECQNEFQSRFEGFQTPFLMQPIWKTKGQSPELADNAFDIFVWSDFALCRAFIDRASSKAPVTRYTRSTARLSRALFELSSTGKISVSSIYHQMSLGNQTDKELALSGNETREYMISKRRVSPKLKKEIVSKIILNGGEKNLLPERRFDATIYFTAKELFERNKE